MLCRAFIALVAVAQLALCAPKTVVFTALDPNVTSPADFWMPLSNPIPQEYCTYPRYPIVPAIAPIAENILYELYPNGTIPEVPAKPTNVWQKNLWGFQFDNFDDWGAVYPYPYVVSPKVNTLLLMYPSAPVHGTDNSAMQEGFTTPGPNNNYTNGPPIYNASYPWMVMSAGFDLTLAVHNGDNLALSSISPAAAKVTYKNSFDKNATVAEVYMVKGSPMISLECNGANLGFGFGMSPPVIAVNGMNPGAIVTSKHLILTVAQGPNHPQGTYWHAFFDYPVTVEVPIGAQIINLTEPYTGLLQLGVGELDDVMAPLLIEAAGTYARDMTLQYEIDDEANTMNLNFVFDKVGNVSQPLIMLGLRHHISILEPKTPTTPTIFWAVKGNLTAVQADTWVLQYNLTSAGFGDTLTVEPTMLAEVKAALLLDYKMFIDGCPGDNDTWGYPGYMNMELYAYARDLTQMVDVAIGLEAVGERDYATNMTIQVMKCMSYLLKRPEKAPHKCPPPINNTAVCVRDQMDLYYDTQWGGLITGWYNRFAAHYCQCDRGNPYACIGYNYCDNPTGWSAFSNYGNAFYNDHHFQYGYVIKNLAWAIYFQKKGANLNISAAAMVNLTKQALVFARDISNPNATQDPYFAYNRHKDTFDGHSWAEGYDYSGRILTWVNQQSGGEAINAYYAIYLLGMALNDTNVRDWGRVNLATEMISIAQYQHLSNRSADKKDQPSKEISKWGPCYSMLEGNAGNSATYFGPNSLFECGITVLPISPITPEWISAAWAEEAYEWMQWHIAKGGVCVFFNPNNMTSNPCPGQYGPDWMGNAWECCPTNEGYQRNQWRAYPDWYPHMYLIQSIANKTAAWDNLMVTNVSQPTKALPFPYLNSGGSVVGYADDMTRSGILFTIATMGNRTSQH